MPVIGYIDQRQHDRYHGDNGNFRLIFLALSPFRTFYCNRCWPPQKAIWRGDLWVYLMHIHRIVFINISSDLSLMWQGRPFRHFFIFISFTCAMFSFDNRFSMRREVSFSYIFVQTIRRPSSFGGFQLCDSIINDSCDTICSQIKKKGSNDRWKMLSPTSDCVCCVFMVSCFSHRLLIKLSTRFLISLFLCLDDELCTGFTHCQWNGKSFSFPCNSELFWSRKMSSSNSINNWNCRRNV